MTTFFVSGHLDLTEEEFREHYLERIGGSRSLWENGTLVPNNFVVGDARGCDALFQKYFKECSGTPEALTVYHMLEKPRNNVYNSKTVGGFETDEERDAAMTAVSDFDIAWVRPGRENSGTAKNIARRVSKYSNWVKP